MAVKRGEDFKEKCRRRRGELSPAWKGGISSDKEYVSWLKNRSRIKRLLLSGSHTYSQWKELKKKCGNACVSCKKKEPEIKLTQDHIIPVSMGGNDEIKNIQPLCQKCNSTKHAKEINYLKNAVGESVV